MDMTREGEIQGINDHRLGENGGMDIAFSSINLILVRKSTHWSHLCARSNFSDDIKVLEKERPASLTMGEFLGIF